MASRVRRVAAAGLNDCYVMLTEYERRRAGTWRRELVPTFPSYLFLDVRDREALERGLRLVTEPAELPRVGGVASALPADDAALLRALAGRDHVIRVSRGSIEDLSLTTDRQTTQEKSGEVERERFANQTAFSN